MRKEWIHYLDKNIKELKNIQPKWAYGRNYRKARYTQDLLKAGCTIYHARLVEVIKCVDFGELKLDKLFNGENNNDRRIAEIIYRWDNDLFIDPPNIYVPVGGDKLLFSDGHHRTKTAYLLGQMQIPIVVANEDIFFIKKLLQLSRKQF